MVRWSEYCNLIGWIRVLFLIIAKIKKKNRVFLPGTSNFLSPPLVYLLSLPSLGLSIVPLLSVLPICILPLFFSLLQVSSLVVGFYLWSLRNLHVGWVAVPHGVAALTFSLLPYLMKRPLWSCHLLACGVVRYGATYTCWFKLCIPHGLVFLTCY